MTTLEDSTPVQMGFGPERGPINSIPPTREKVGDDLGGLKGPAQNLVQEQSVQDQDHPSNCIRESIDERAVGVRAHDVSPSREMDQRDDGKGKLKAQGHLTQDQDP